MMKRDVMRFLMVACLILAACAAPQSTIRHPVTQSSGMVMMDPSMLMRTRAEIVLAQSRLTRVMGTSASTQDVRIEVFANERPRRLPTGLVRRVLAEQDALDQMLMRYAQNGGHVWCERPITYVGGRVTYERLPFVGLPRYHDVLGRQTRCFVADDPSSASLQRTPIEPYVLLGYSLGPGNDLTNEEYTTERYPLPPLEPIPGPTPLPIVCFDEHHLFCHVVEDR